MLLIEKGNLTDPGSGREGAYDILIRGEKIVRIGRSLRGSMTEDELAACRIVDASGLTAVPGLVDVHVHFREPGFTHKEDIDTGAAAAAKGGFTTVVLMANTKPAVDNAETLSYVLRRGKETPIHVETCANVTMGLGGSVLTPMEELAAMGAVGFTDDGIPLLDGTLTREAMIRAAALDLPLSFHEENPEFIVNNGINRGRVSDYLGIGGSSREAEISMVKRDLELALETGACVNIQHISSREAVELVRSAKRRGGRIHAEAAPHHFTLTQEDVIRYGALAKMNPPLREEADRQAILEGLQDGTIDLIATDHAPHTADEKGRGLVQAPSGIIGLETALPLGVTVLVEGGVLSFMELIRRMSTSPAAMYRLDAGYLEEGGPADVTLVDTGALEPAGNFVSKSSNSPFTGWLLRGAVRMTVCAGRVAYEALTGRVPSV